MLAVLSPAKSLDFSCPSALPATNPPALQETAELIALLREKSPQDLMHLMRISEALGNLNAERYQTFSLPQPTDAQSCIFAFAGDVYQGLDAATLAEDEIHYAQGHLRILSGLYGVLAPLDQIQPYRLEMGTRLANPKGTNLYQFWGERITELLNEAILGCQASALLNLASAEYFKAVKPKQLAVPVIEPRFRERRNGKLMMISFFAKKARGAFARYVIQNRLTDADQLQTFAEDGYAYDPAESSPGKPTFVRG